MLTTCLIFINILFCKTWKSISVPVFSSFIHGCSLFSGGFIQINRLCWIATTLQLISYYVVLCGSIKDKFFLTVFTQMFVTNIKVKRGHWILTEMTSYYILKVVLRVLTLYDNFIWTKIFFIMQNVFIIISITCND